MEKKTKKCPYCGGEILEVAKKCKHCGKWIEPQEAKPEVKSVAPQPTINYVPTQPIQPTQPINPNQQQESSSSFKISPIAVFGVIMALIVIGLICVTFGDS